MIDHEKYKTIVSPTLIWPQISSFFDIEEPWGDHNKIDIRLLWNLYCIREELNRGMNILNAFALSGHSKNSFHKKGMAVDFYVTNTKSEELWNLYCFFLNSWYGGVGVYPFWKPCPGFHLDIGPNYRTWTRTEDGLYLYDSKEIREVIYKFMGKTS